MLFLLGLGFLACLLQLKVLGVYVGHAVFAKLQVLVGLQHMWNTEP